MSSAGHHDDTSPSRYRGSNGEYYKSPGGGGYAVLPIFPFLVGQPWDNIALAVVSTLEPRKIRVTQGVMTCDAPSRRVTVIVDENDIIQSIRWEANFSSDPSMCGAELDSELKARGIDIN